MIKIKKYRKTKKKNIFEFLKEFTSINSHEYEIFKSVSRYHPAIYFRSINS